MTALSFCAKAAARLAHLSQRYKGSALLVSVEGGGCSGLKYSIKPTNDTPLELDEVIDVEGTKIIVCGKSMMYLLGTNVSWVEDIMGDRFEFTNPNAGATCGCGETFTPRKLD
jgi:iron-sulfur cluster assembly accessory protein